jgi:hypothetical protein
MKELATRKKFSACRRKMGDAGVGNNSRKVGYQLDDASDFELKVNHINIFRSERNGSRARNIQQS